MTFTELLLPEFEEEMKNTRKVLERVPDGKNDYKPHDKSMSLGRLASHVAELPGWAKMTLEVEELDLQPGMQPQIANSRSELLAMFDKNVAEARQAIQSANEEDWGKMWTLKFGGNTIFSLPRRVVARMSVINHLIHHRAQLGVYLRLNDIAIPGMYGPSADEANMFTGQAA